MNLPYIGSSFQKHVCLYLIVMICSLCCFPFEITGVTLLFINHRVQVYIRVLAVYSDLPGSSCVLLHSVSCMSVNFIFASKAAEMAKVLGLCRDINLNLSEAESL